MKRDVSLFVASYIAIFLILAGFLLWYSRNTLFPSLSPTTTPTLEPSVTFTGIAVIQSETTSTLAITPTYTFTPTSSPTATIQSITPSAIPVPIKGTVVANAPALFRVESWRDNYFKCSTDINVVIYGVIISHGAYPYRFTFWSQKEPYTPYVPEIRRIEPLKNSRDYIEFIPPVIVVKGSYKHVELTFRRDDGKQVTWIDDLFYPLPDVTCK